METTELEMELKNGKFFILESRNDEKNIKRFIYCDTKPAIERLKELIKTVSADKLVLSAVDISTKNWNITGIPWSLIATGFIRGDIDLIESIENIEKAQEKIEKIQEKQDIQKKR
jgi:hypothetical protein